MTLTQTDLQSIKEILKPEFDKVHTEAKQNFTILNKKIESLRRSNRKDHNLIIDIYDKRAHKLEDRVTTLENKSMLPAFKNL